MSKYEEDWLEVFDFADFILNKAKEKSLTKDKNSSKKSFDTETEDYSEDE